MKGLGEFDRKEEYDKNILGKFLMKNKPFKN